VYTGHVAQPPKVLAVILLVDLLLLEAVEETGVAFRSDESRYANVRH